MKSTVTSLVLLTSLVTGCDRRHAVVSQETLKRIRAADPSLSEACLDLIKFGGLEAMPLKVDRCYPMAPARSWHCLWSDAFEGQRFCPAPAQECSYETAGDKFWIEFAPGTRPTGRSPTGLTYSISFIGRRTLTAGSHGHFGMWPYAIVADKIISIAPAGTDPLNRKTHFTERRGSPTEM